ncbi:MAG: hypothetical protein GF398_03085 [Chitinivibrionales bacterium]|nr:hypothetical protein [Chitinivibrionales bacterium]
MKQIPMNGTTIFAVVMACMSAPVCLYAQEEIDEDALFSDTTTVIELEQFTDDTALQNAEKRKSVEFSGAITTSVTGALNRDYFLDDASLDNTSFRAGITGNFTGDIRLPFNVKSLVNFDAQYLAPTDSTDLALRELFLDWNLKRRVFLRGGKQVLQWGRGYFFNPVDLVNVEKTRFFDELAGREGAFGVKAHAPFGTKLNLYAFWDLHHIGRIDTSALAGKAEFLVGATEFAVSLWGKRGEMPVYGLDFSTGIWNFSITGELAIYHEIDHYELAGWQFNLPRVEESTKEWSPKASLGITRWFDLLDINDRILVTLEGYYNHNGIDDENLIDRFPDNQVLDPASFAALEQLFRGGILEFNSISKWYAAAFVTVNRFIVTDMTVSFNALTNILQRSTTLSAIVDYRTLHNLSISLLVNGFVGPDFTEYTFFAGGASVEGRIGILF